MKTKDVLLVALTGFAAWLVFRPRSYNVKDEAERIARDFSQQARDAWK